MIYKKANIGDLVTLCQGFAINKKTNHHISEEPTSLHLLRIGDMKNGNFSIFVKDTIPKKFIAKEHDIIYTRTGQVGLVFRKQNGVIHNNCFTVTSKDDKILYQEFLYYVLQEKLFYEEAISRATGAAQPDLPHDAFNSIQIFLPPIDSQIRITEILNSYDNLIENNQKQIKLLEEAAQRLYKEWFVDLRFPEHEKVEVVDGVPKGWKKVALSKVIEYEIGGGWGEENATENCNSTAFVIRGTDLYGITHGDFKNIPFRYHSSNNLKSRRIKSGDIVFEVSGGSKTEGVAKTVLINQDFINNLHSDVICASFCKLVRPIENYSQYLYDTFKYLRVSGQTTAFDKKSASSIVNYRWKDFLEQQEILCPCDNIIQYYNRNAKFIYRKIISLSIMIEKLKEARDCLLPKLMSGELEV